MMNQILIEKVKQNLRQLRLKDMADALVTTLAVAENQRQGHLAFLSELTEIQLKATDNRSLERRIQKANLPRNMTFDNFDWNFQPGLNVEQLKNLMELGFVLNKQPLLILGKSGTGKTHISSALGTKACQAGLKTQFITLQELLTRLYASLADDSTDELIAKFIRNELLIIDHMGYIRTKPEYPSLLFDLISACQDSTALIINSNISFEEWSTALGNLSITANIIDRIFHKACLINIKPGKSYRTQGPHSPSLTLSQNDLD
ncbi:MAG: ATP-binding protein [Desulfamplus sp.]|nr:ATP-binding protein [Desulfamplus sp.]